MRYRDRADAGRALAASLTRYAGQPAASVIGLARGGVVVAAAVAAVLDLPLDVLVVRKLGLPWAPEVAFGALAPGGIVVRDTSMAPPDAAEVVQAEQAELRRRTERYGRPPLDLRDRIAILVDDGLATGASAHAAVESARSSGAARVVFAVPVGAPDGLDGLRDITDEVVCPHAPAGFRSVSGYYREFPQITDAEVVALLS